MTHPGKPFLAVTVLAVLLAAPAVADAGTSHTTVWETKTVVCGIESPDLSKTDVLCQARGVPRPPHGSTDEGDPGVVIAAHGKPQLILMSQDEYPANSRITTLSNGTVWSARGVTCEVARTIVTCENESRHGFMIGNGRYEHF